MEAINHPVYFDVGTIQPTYYIPGTRYMGCSTLVLMASPRDTAGNVATTPPHIIVYLVACHSSPLFISENKYLLNLISCKLYLLIHHHLDST